MKQLLSILLITASMLAHAWEPAKPVQVYVGNTPGAGNEIAFRKLAEIVQRSHPNFGSCGCKQFDPATSFYRGKCQRLCR